MTAKDAKVNVDEMAKAGVNFGHRISKLHPKMKQYVAGIKNNVHIFMGNSGTILPKIIKQIPTNKTITFWLDAHYSGGQTSFFEKKCPILDELNSIKEHIIKEHTILIDDMRLFGTEAHDNIQISEITDLILSINPNYKFTFEGDILVAEVQNEY